MKLRTIIDAVPSLQKLSSSDLRIQFSYQVKKLTDILQEDCNFFDEKREELIQKYGRENELGQFIVPEENQKELQKAFDELLDIDVNITFDKIKIPLSENLKLSPNDIGFLIPFVEFIETE